MTRQQTASAPTSKAIWPLEPLNFFTADMQAGIGHFLGVFLLAHGRESGLIGFEGGRNARQLPKQRHEPRARRPDGPCAYWRLSSHGRKWQPVGGNAPVVASAGATR